MIPDGESSKDLTSHRNNYIVFSAAGMCNAGRVLFHLEKDLPNPKSTIIFTGYQAVGTLGRKLVEGCKQVKIEGKVINVRAKIASINAFSAHLDQNGLIKWLNRIEKGYTLFLAHGEPESQRELKETIALEGIIARKDVCLTSFGKRYSLYKGGFEVETLQEEIPKNKVVGSSTKFKEIERIRTFLQTTPTSCLDSETMRLIGALESRLTREMTKAKKLAKCQSKPNRKNTGRSKK